MVQGKKKSGGPPQAPLRDQLHHKGAQPMFEKVPQRDDMDRALDVARDFLRYELGADAERFMCWAPSMAMGARNSAPENFDWSQARKRSRLVYSHRHLFPEIADRMKPPRAGIIPGPRMWFARWMLRMAADVSRHLTAMQLLALAILCGIEQVPDREWSEDQRLKVKRRWEIIHTRAGAWVITDRNH